MKVLHIIDSGGLYGAEMVLLSLAAEQLRMGLEPVIASIGETGEGEKPLETAAREKGIPVEKFRMRRGPNLNGAMEILHFAQRRSFQILHSHGYKGDILLGFIPRKWRQIPLVATLHGWTSVGGDRKMGLYEWFDAKSLGFMDAVIVVSGGMLTNRRLKNLDKLKPVTIENGIPMDDFGHERIMPDDPIPHFCVNGFIIGSVGRLSREKGYDLLVETVGILRKEGLDARLVIIGEGPERKNLQGLANDLQIKDWVFLPGYREKARRFMSLFNVFVLCSLTEGLPVSLLEAMAAGVPAVCTAVGGVPEVLDHGEAGTLVRPGDRNALADGIRQVFEDGGAITEKTETAKANVYSRYSGRTMAIRYREVYERILDRKLPVSSV